MGDNNRMRSLNKMYLHITQILTYFSLIIIPPTIMIYPQKVVYYSVDVRG